MKNFIKTNKNGITVFLLIAIIINIVTIRIFDAPLKNEVCKSGIVSFELAKDLDNSINILNSWDTNAKINMSLSLGFDFLFIVVYSSFIALLIFNINNSLWEGKPYYKLGKLLIVMIFIAALFDVGENIALIKLLFGDLNQTWSSAAYYFATIKFTIVIICIVYLIINWGILIFKKINHTKTRNNIHV